MSPPPAAPLVFGALSLALWEALVRLFDVPPYILPGPIAIAGAFAADPRGLLAALVATLAVTFTSLVAACLLGVALAGVMSASRWARAAIQPWAVALQVTPIVAIAPLIIIWVNAPFASLVVCATIVAFFPVFSSTAAGLAATPRELLDLFRLNGAGRWQELRLLRLPAASPWSARWWRNSSPAPAASRPASPTASSKPATGCKFRACSRPLCCCPWPGWRSIPASAGSNAPGCARTHESPLDGRAIPCDKQPCPTQNPNR